MEVPQGTVIVDFYADWCMPCVAIKKSLEEIETESPDVTVIRLNVDEDQESVKAYGVQSIPTLILFQNGEEVRRTVGAASKASLLSSLGL
jgi:thioredoxin 1